MKLPCALLAGFAALAGAPAATAGGVELIQRLGTGRTLKIVVSHAGASATELEQGQPRGGTTIRYGDSRVFLLDFSNRTYTEESIAEAARRVAQDRTLTRRAHAEIVFPTRSGLPEFPKATIAPTALRAKIAGVPTRAYLLREGGGLHRVWLALNLPLPAPAVLVRAQPAFDVPALAGRVILRAEMRLGKRWRRGLDTTRSRRVVLDADALRPPKGWRRVSEQSRRPAWTPAMVDRGIGPVSARPSVFALYWGSFGAGAFRGPMDSFLASIVAAPSPVAYWAPLAQYGVAAGAFVGSSPIIAPLPRVVGIFDFLAVNQMVTLSFIVTGAPKIWWRFGSRDPLIAIFVPESSVIKDGWDGYHLFSPSAAWLLPWPVSLAAHPLMPWLLTLVPVKMTVPVMADTTVRMTHELVEAVTDPIPLSANVDVHKFPLWAEGEVADICDSTPTPATRTSTRFSFTVSRYWANSPGACVG